MGLLNILSENCLVPAGVSILTAAGILCGIRTRLVQFRCLGKSLSLPFRRGQEEGAFQASMTALGGMMGAGNIIGVAAALQAGGAGSIFWICLTAFLGMGVKYAEIYLSCRTGEGPMRYITGLLSAPGAGKLYAALCVLASLLVGNAAQGNAAGLALDSLLGGKDLLFGTAAALFGLLLFAGLCGGNRRIVRISGIITPLLAAGYVGGCLLLILMQAEKLPSVLQQIISEALGIRPCGAGISVGLLLSCMKCGMTRGLFTNESGMGTAGIIHAETKLSPHQAGLWGIFEVFCDTVVMCSLTALSLLVYLPAAAADPAAAFTVWNQGFGWGGKVFLTCSLIGFAWTAALGWACCGKKALSFLCGPRSCAEQIYMLIFSMTGSLSFFWKTDVVLIWSDLVNIVILLLNSVCICAVICIYPDVFYKNRE